MIGIITLGLAGIVFLLGIIVMQIGSLKSFGWLATLGVGAVFVASLLLSGLLALVGISSF